MRLGPWEIVAILIVILLIFGPNRITKVAGEMGKSIKAFKDGLSTDKESPDDDSDETENKEK